MLEVGAVIVWEGILDRKASYNSAVWRVGWISDWVKGNEGAEPVAVNGLCFWLDGMRLEASLSASCSDFPG